MLHLKLQSAPKNVCCAASVQLKVQRKCMQCMLHDHYCTTAWCCICTSESKAKDKVPGSRSCTQAGFGFNTGVSPTSGLPDLVGPQGVRNAAGRALHHPRERRRSLGGVRRRALPHLPQTLHHGAQPGRHGRGPLVAGQGGETLLRLVVYMKDPFHPAFSRTVGMQREAGRVMLQPGASEVGQAAVGRRSAARRLRRGARPRRRSGSRSRPAAEASGGGGQSEEFFCTASKHSEENWVLFSFFFFFCGTVDLKVTVWIFYSHTASDGLVVWSNNKTLNCMWAPLPLPPPSLSQE